MTKEFCDICGRPIETHKNVSEFKLKKAVHTLCGWRELCKQIADITITYEPMEDNQ